MVLKNPSVFSFLLSPKLGFGSNNKPDTSSRPRNPEKHAQHWNTQSGMPVGHGQDQLCDQDSDPFRVTHVPPDRGMGVNPVDSPQDLSRARSNPTPTHLQPPRIVTPDGGIGESPKPARYAARHSRSSFTGFFAFSSRRKSSHGPPIIQFQQEHLAPPSPVPGRWLPGRIQTEAHIVDRSTLPSPLRTEEEDYYYSYYTPLTPTAQSSSTSPQRDATDMLSPKRLSLRPQEFIGNQDLDSQASSPVDYHPPDTQLSHPYAYSSPLPKSAFESHPPHRLRHAASQQIQHHSRGSHTQSHSRLAHSRLPPSAASHDVSQSQSSLTQPPLKMSISTPNLASSAPDPFKSPSKKKSLHGSKVERWLSAETWWDALLSPSPRFKVKQASRQDADVGRNTRTPAGAPVDPEPQGDLGAPSSPPTTARPRAASSASLMKPARPALTKSRSTADLIDHPSTSAFPRAGFEPALEPLADEPTPTGEHNPTADAELSLPEPPLSLTQVIDEGEALDQQRAQWKLQASKSLGNKHTRSLSRARSKSLSEKHVRGRHTSESSKSQSHLEFLAARTLLGSQSTMPTVHISKPSGSSPHSKPYSHSHSQSAFSHTHTHTSHSHTYSHSHSHSLTTSNSSKSSRNPRGHSRNESWGKTALLKAGALCGVGADESYAMPVDHRVPSSSRADVHTTAYLGEPVDADRAAEEGNRKISPSPSVPSGEVGIAISSPPASEGCPELSMPDHPYAPGPQQQDGDHELDENHRSSKHTHKSSDYAGPHPTTLDSLNLPQHAVVNDVSMRHRLPPRAAVQLPIGPISHPYGPTSPRTPERRQRSGSTTLQVPGTRAAAGQSAERSFLPHISLSHADFERYGVGEALVYASSPRSEDVARGEEENAQRASSPVVEPPPLPPSPSPPPLQVPPPPPLRMDQSPPRETVVLSPEDPEHPISSTFSDAPSLTSSTIHMVMSAFRNPDNINEFQDLFYKPQLPTTDQLPEPITTSISIPTDVRSSESSSPLDNLVRSLSVEMNEMRDVSRTPSDPVRLQSTGTESQMDHPSSEGGTKYVFMDLVRSYSSSPVPMEPGTSVQVPIQKESELVVQPTSGVPEDVTSSRASSVLESALGDTENDTFGYPIWHGHLQAITPPAPTPTPRRASMQLHLSIVDTTMSSENPSTDASAAADNDEQADMLSPIRPRFNLSSSSTDAVRASYLTTTSDASRMSGLSDFPLPPNVRPGGHLGHVSILQAYFEGNSSESDGRSRERPVSTDDSHYEDEDDEDEDERRHGERDDDDGDWDRRSHEEAEETVPVPRSPMRVTSYESHRTTFGGSEDMDFITQLHGVGP